MNLTTLALTKKKNAFKTHLNNTVTCGHANIMAYQKLRILYLLIK